MHAPHLPRTARVSAVTGLGAAVLVSAFARRAMAEPVDAVQRTPAKIVAVKTDSKRKTVVVKRGDNLSKIAKRAKLASWRPIWDLNKKISHPNLIYPGQKLLIPAKGEKVKHRPLPARAVPRVVSQERSAAPASSSRRPTVRRSVSTSSVGGSGWDRLAPGGSGGNLGPTHGQPH